MPGRPTQTRSLRPIDFVRAIASGTTDLDVKRIPSETLAYALDLGLGPVLAYVTAEGGSTSDSDVAGIRGADLTARILTGNKLDALTLVLEAGAAVGCTPLLLKGVATALQYYPSPHLRTMGDIDVMVPDDYQLALEEALLAVGFVRQSSQPPDAFVGRHHSMPLCLARKGVWIDIHTRVIPRQYPSASEVLFSPVSIASQVSHLTVGDQRALAMRHELQLRYTCARWAERYDSPKGIFAILDAAMLIRKHGRELDWDRVYGQTNAAWSNTALHVMLSFLARSGVADVPEHVLSRLAARDAYANRAIIALAHRLIDAYVAPSEPVARVVGQVVPAVTWTALLAEGPPWQKVFAVPYKVAFPPGDPNRYSPVVAWQRVLSLLRRFRGDS